MKGSGAGDLRILNSCAVRAFFGPLIGRTIDQFGTRLEQFFAPVVGGLQIARSWGEEGLWELEKPGELNRLLVPLMRQDPQISWLKVTAFAVSAASTDDRAAIITKGMQGKLRQTPKRSVAGFVATRSKRAPAPGRYLYRRTRSAPGGLLQQRG